MVLKVGLDIGVLSPVLYAMMGIVALVTTFMTSPLLSLVHSQRIRVAAIPTPVPAS